MELFANRRLVIATKHQKEQVIAPVLSSRLRVKPFVPDNFDTDRFGTFSGEIPRHDTPEITARSKALAALALTGDSLSVASEGSFGPHPSAFFLPFNQEVLVFLDLENNLEIIQHYSTPETNYDRQEITSLADLMKFTNRVGYPEHGIILRIYKAGGKDKLLKSLDSLAQLDRTIKDHIEEGWQIEAQTDMRAMNNPTRMRAIAAAAQLLTDRILSICPECSSPGFGLGDVIKGLPCASCKRPTRSIRAYIHLCKRCGNTLKVPREDKAVEDPRYCDYCNP